jgi:hypothetical protein
MIPEQLVGVLREVASEIDAGTVWLAKFHGRAYCLPKQVP